MLVKVEGSSTVYMVVNCVLRPFNTAAIFYAKGKKFKDVKIIRSLLAIGREIGHGSDYDDTIVIPLTSSSTPPTISGLPEGSIVKIPGSSTVYMVSDGVLKPFTSITVFTAHKKDFKNIKVISAEQFAGMSLGDPVNFPNGTLVKGSGNTVFVVENGHLLGITSLAVLNKHRWSLKNLLRVNDNELKDLKRGGNKED